MTPAQKVKLKYVVERNKDWPLVVVGAAGHKSNEATIIPATISERSLHTDALVIKSYLVIDGLDTISEKEQAKFITLLKDRRTGMRKLPNDVQIIIPVNSADKLSKAIKDLVLIYNV